MRQLLSARLLFVMLAVCLAAACGDDGGGSPTGPTNPPATTTATLSGTVTSVTGAGLVGAIVTALDGANAGRTTTTTAGGQYTFSGIQSGNGNFGAVAPGFGEQRKGITISLTGTNSLSFSLTPAAPFSMAGTGNTVFDKPSYVTRVRITGQYTGNSSNFIVWCGSNLLVNELLGRAWGPTTYDGTHAAPNCSQVEIRNSTGVSWTFAEVR